MKDWEYLKNWQWDVTHVVMAAFLVLTTLGGLMFLIYLVQSILVDVLAARRRRARCAEVYGKLRDYARKDGAPESPPGPQ